MLRKGMTVLPSLRTIAWVEVASRRTARMSFVLMKASTHGAMIQLKKPPASQ